MKYFYLITILWIAACNDNKAIDNNNVKDSTTFVTTDTIPDIRQIVSKKPVATYLVTVNDPKLERTFGVDIYETRSTFEYIMRMHYEAMQETDTLKIPNFGIWPEIKVNKGPEKVSCVIGFLDKKKIFKPYKMVTAKGNHMKLIVLKKYFTGRYRTKVND